jgi:hypothetical protein
MDLAKITRQQAVLEKEDAMNKGKKDAIDVKSILSGKVFGVLVADICLELSLGVLN